LVSTAVVRDDAVIAVIEEALRQRSTVPDPGAASCAACHAEEARKWHGSQHANANRLVSAEHDQAAFDPARTLAHGSFHTTTRWADDGPEFESDGPDGTTVHRPEAVIGIEPLVQYLAPFPGGRLQVIDVSHDPHQDEWFNAFGDEDRQPHEWGFWQNRSMNWNTRCAFCHMTGFEKNYEPATDTFASTWDAMGISCAQCHQIDDPHGATVHPDCPVSPGKVVKSPETIMANCASCHSRREELTSDFHPGDSYHDHFRLALLSQPGVYHEDGQVRDENFEYGSFISSRMHHAGVSCLDCHDPHSGGMILPIENNAMCLSCHAPPGNRNATAINPLTHSRHEFGSTGARCVNCHMPETTYMQNDPRRDHGFTIPDPLLTLELDVPNACNRCHTDEDAQWAADWTKEWHGENYNTATRDRARVMRRAAENDATVVPELLALSAAQEIPLWRASLIALLNPWASQAAVSTFLVAELNHEDPMVRAAAVRALSPLPGAAPVLATLRDDPTRLVRLEAAWVDPAGADLSTDLAAEQERWLTVNSDQPAGAVRRGQQALARRDYAEAERWIRIANEWDPAPYSHHLLGRVLHAAGKTSDAITEITRAIEMAPTSSEYSYELALILAETGDTDGVIKYLELTVANAPDFGRAWYNLGLAYAGQEKLASALRALAQAETHLPGSPDAAYAAATIHLRTDNREAAIAAAERALARDPNNPGLRGFMQQLRRMP
jgi:tetratricopeptide (TPR) repeat protein